GNDISVVRPAVRVAHTAIGKPGGDTQSSLTDLMSRANAAGGQARTFDSDADAQNVLNSLPLTN
ncbi:MAG: hypothetical protein LBT45_02585, partial [Rickettsiales bacterium]|nr:hypothetical protein [Rickettsiales bacterium]